MSETKMSMLTGLVLFLMAGSCERVSYPSICCQIKISSEIFNAYPWYQNWFPNLITELMLLYFVRNIHFKSEAVRPKVRTFIFMLLYLSICVIQRTQSNATVRVPVVFSATYHLLQLTNLVWHYIQHNVCCWYVTVKCIFIFTIIPHMGLNITPAERSETRMVKDTSQRIHVSFSLKDASLQDSSLVSGKFTLLVCNTHIIICV
jgi:hypothetical protein